MKDIDADFLLNMKGLDNCTPAELDALYKHCRSQMRRMLTQLLRTARTFELGYLSADNAADLLSGSREIVRDLKSTASTIAEGPHTPEKYRADFAEIADNVPQIIPPSPETAKAAWESAQASRERWLAQHAERKAVEDALWGKARALVPLFREIGLRLERSVMGEDEFYLARMSGTRKSKAMPLPELVAMYLPGVDYAALESEPSGLRHLRTPEEQAEYEEMLEREYEEQLEQAAEDDAIRERAAELKPRFKELGYKLTASRGYIYGPMYWLVSRETGVRVTETVSLDELEAQYLGEAR